MARKLTPTERAAYQILSWPLQSPNLNVIENLWQIYESKPLESFLKIAPGELFMKNEILVACLEKWATIEQNKIDEVVNTMSHHIKTVIQAGAGVIWIHILVAVSRAKR